MASQQNTEDDKNEQAPPQYDWCKWLGLIIVAIAFAVVAVILFYRMQGTKQAKVRRGGSSMPWGAKGGCGCMAGSSV